MYSALTARDAIYRCCVTASVGLVVTRKSTFARVDRSGSTVANTRHHPCTDV